jgi:MFS family permease
MEELEHHLLVRTAGWYYTSLFYRNLSARICSLYFFLLEGVLTGIWSISLSYIQDHLNLSDSGLGLAVLFSALGTAVTAPITAYLMQKFGIKYVALAAGIAYTGFLPLLGLSKTLITLSVTMFVYGLAWGMVDIAANSSAVLTEIVAGKTLLGSFHGSYSLAAATGSLIGALMTTNHIGILNMFLIFFAICGSLSVLFHAALYDFQQEKVIAEYNNSMTALHLRGSEAARPSLPRHFTDKSTGEVSKEVVNEIVAGAEPRAASTETPMKPAAVVESEIFTMEDKQHITYTTDWKTDANLWRHADSPSDAADLLTPLVGEATEEPVRPTFHPVTDRSRLLSDDIGHYEVRNSQGNSIVTIADPVNANLLVYLGCLCFLAAFGEGSLVTWMVIYFDRVLGATSLDKSAGFICFMVAMAMGRFTCDYLRRLYGRKLMVFCGGVLSVSGLMVVFAVSTLPTQPALALSSIGLTVTGLGLSTLLPVCFSSAGHLTDVLHSGTSVATVAICAYCGSIAGSPLVGVLSDMTGSLRYGFLFIAVVLAAIVPLSLRIPVENSRMMQL